jgi:GH35 family endo-1,4-beta-xylanase
VVNEPYQQRDILDVLGHDVMDRWFHLAREADPDAKLFINENGFLSDPSTSSAKTDYYYDLVRGMRDRGVPIDGVGMQAHFTGQLPSMDHVFAVLDRFADLGVRLKITELDVDAGDKELEARFLADIVTAAFSHEAMDAIILWGFWEGRHWKPTAALLNQDFSPRITGDVWNNLLTERWHTDANLTTNAAGQATFRGFHGDYTLTIIHNTRTTTHTAHLTESGTLRLTLPE